MLLLLGHDIAPRNWFAAYSSVANQPEEVPKSSMSYLPSNSCISRVAGATSPSVDSQDSRSDRREFPYPATKLITGQHIWVHPTGLPWACLVVGSFYDAADHELWRIELLLGYRDDQDSSSDLDSDIDPRGETGARGDNLSTTYQDLNFTEDGYLIITTTTQIDIELHPFLHKAGPTPLNCNLETTSRAYSQLGFSLPPANIPAFMASQIPGQGGWNPRFGWDAEGGPAPNAQGYGNAVPGPYPPVAYPQPQAPMYPWPQYGYYGANGYYPNQRVPQPHPRVSLDVPGMNMVNSTGGAGCEPGYNYIFHDNHTKIHVFKTSEPPWRAPNMNYSFAKFQVPTNTTIAELMLRFGACNPNPALNRITEVVEGGSGRWYRGMVFQGDQEADCQKTLRECGWDNSRSGREKAVVWLWITKD
ncbi:hypothetical protein F4803DRAFT_556524 [Xylaria telfairii]|nr:hypothetical protein F4803DRAFT_556524 [Xylaria telfairii]